MEARPWKKSARELKSTLSSSSSSYAIANLPDPLLMEILCRMSIKTLTISKSVCKSWLNLIKDPHFCLMHQQRSPTEVCFQRSNDVRGDILELHLGNFHLPSCLDPCRFEIPKFSVGPGSDRVDKAIKGRLIFANSCNGLLCYYSDPEYRYAVVWNPCTSEFITVPPPRNYCRGYGLGFSRKEKKFKLLRLMYEGSNYTDVVADICTIEKSGSWKRVGPSTSHAWLCDYSNKVWDLHAVFLQGTLHWVITDSHESSFAIHTFDFEDEHFGSLALPPDFNEGSLREERLGVLGGCLFVSDYTDGGVTIWLMREYGVQDSWTKLFSLGSSIFTDAGLKIKYSRCLPIAYMDTGEILMKCTSRTAVILYNPVQRIARVLGSGPKSLRVIAYRPSLVLLKDSMLGYHVHVKSDLEQEEISTTPNWWKPVENRLVPVKKSAKREDRMERITNMMWEVLEELKKDREQKQVLEERLRNELEPLKEQTKHLKLQTRQLQERQEDELGKVKQLVDQMKNLCNKQKHKQKIVQMMDEMKVAFDELALGW